MTVEINIKNKEIFPWNFFAKQNKDYFSNIDIKSVTDTKKFWKTIKPYFSNIGLNSNKIFLSEKGRLRKDPVVIATTVTKTDSVWLPQFEDHTSIIRIKSNLDNFSDNFDFKKVHEKELKREITNLNSKKATCHGAILAKILT